MLARITHKQKNVIYGVVILSALGMVLWLGYSWRQRIAQEQAFKAFAESLEELQEGIVSSKQDTHSKELWSDIERAFKTGFEQHTNTTLAPFFLAFQASALSRQGKSEEALQVLTDAVEHMPKKSPLYFAYATKLALLQMDAADITTQEIGQKALHALAENTKNPQQFMALYYLGYTAWVQNNKPGYEQSWTKLVELAGKDSFWTQLVSSHINFLA